MDPVVTITRAPFAESRRTDCYRRRRTRSGADADERELGEHGMVLFLIDAVFWWALRRGQFDYLDGPAHRILMDDTSARLRASAPDRGL